METFNRIASDVSLGRAVKIFGFANLYGCTVGDESRIGCFVEIQRNATVGARCKISSHAPAHSKGRGGAMTAGESLKRRDRFTERRTLAERDLLVAHTRQFGRSKERRHASL